MSTPVTLAERTSPPPNRPAPIADWLDEELLLLLRSGDPAAYGEIYRRYHVEVRRFARSLVGPDDVDDVVADSFTRVLTAIENGKGPVDHPARYLMVTVRTAASAVYRRRASQERTTERLRSDRTMTDELSVHEDPDLVAAFRSLPDRARHVLWATIVEGRDHGEIGEELGLSRNAVAALAYRQRQALRTAYAEQRRLSDEVLATDTLTD